MQTFSKSLKMFEMKYERVLMELCGCRMTDSCFLMTYFIIFSIEFVFSITLTGFSDIQCTKRTS